MRTNIVIDDQLMADVMASGDYKTKKEAVEEGLRLLRRRKAYAALLAARGTLPWDDSDEAWARAQAGHEGAAETVQEPAAPFNVTPAASADTARAAATSAKSRTRSRST